MAEPIIQNAIKATNPMAPYTVKYCNISCPLANPEPIAKARYVPATVMIKLKFDFFFISFICFTSFDYFSYTTLPSIIVINTGILNISSLSWIIVNGFFPRTTISASFPASIIPSSFSLPQANAEPYV